jgi:hypothetical protein
MREEGLWQTRKNRDITSVTVRLMNYGASTPKQLLASLATLANA